MTTTSQYILALACAIVGFCFDGVLFAATATNAYVTVGCSTDGVKDIVPVGDDFYITTRNVNKPSFRADITVAANSPYYLVKPADRKMNLGIGEKDEYKVKDESGNEDKFSGKVHVLKLDIEPTETNVCRKSTSCTLKLTDDSYPGGTAEWTSSPVGISGRGNSVTFGPNSLTAGVYTVTARSGIVSSYTDTCIVRVFDIELITPNGDPVNAPVDSGDGQNEFTFSGANPGILTMDLKAKVIPASAASAITGCQFNVGDIGSSVKNWATNNPNGKATVSGSCLTATVTFTGLPEHNSDFGKKTATASWNGVICDTNDYEVFFPKTATNHPSGQVGSPNWFYYWNMVCGDSNAVFNVSLPDYGQFSPTNPVEIQIGDPAGYVNTTRNDQGIDCFAETVIHESTHRRHYRETKINGSPDSDGDWLKDSDEKFGDLNLNSVQDTEDANGNGVLDNGEDEGLVRMELTLKEFYSGGLARSVLYGRQNRRIDQESKVMIGTSMYHANTGGGDYDDEDDTCYAAESSWSTGSVDALDWANPGKQTKSPY